MENWVITGASGSIGTLCSEELLSRNCNLHVYSRRPIPIKHKNLRNTLVESYSNLDFMGKTYRGIIIAQGFFDYRHLVEIEDEDLENLVSANFISQIHVVRSFLKSVDLANRTDVVILGSTSAYQAGKGTTVYGAAKSGMLGFVKALNDEYLNTDVRFWFISTGTLANEMGAKVPNQDPNSLLDPGLVAKRIIETVTDQSNLWEPEITIRRRHIRLVD
jgi:short-subunit dehydrogenase